VSIYIYIYIYIYIHIHTRIHLYRERNADTAENSEYNVVQFAVKRTDGSPYKNTTHRTLEIEVTHEGEQSRRIMEEVVIPDDAIVRYTVMPELLDQKIYIKVSL